jgi:hypothetical protein
MGNDQIAPAWTVVLVGGLSPSLDANGYPGPATRSFLLECRCFYPHSIFSVSKYLLYFIFINFNYLFY